MVLTFPEEVNTEKECGPPPALQKPNLPTAVCVECGPFATLDSCNWAALVLSPGMANRSTPCPA